MKLLTAALALLVVSDCATFAKSPQRQLAEANAPAPVLVELFTSEGCSSCPPADALLRQLAGTHTSSGQLIVGISEHVTYWDHLGWKDPFSAAEYTRRQEAYAARFGLDSVYTPQMVIDGRQQAVGSDKATVLREIAAEATPASLPVTIDMMAAQGSELVIRFSVHGSAASESFDVFAVVVDDLDRSSVSRGENAGNTLLHVSVARSITKIASGPGSIESTIHLALPPPSPGQVDAGRHLVLFTQARRGGQVAGVASRPIEAVPAGNVATRLAHVR